MLFRRLNKNVQKFEKTLRDALFFSRYYGVFLAYLKTVDKNVYSQAFFENLKSDIYTGFKKAQALIAKEILDIQEKIDVIKVELKSARRRGDKQESIKLEDELDFEYFKETVYRRIADTIVWQMILTQHYVARQLYQPQQNKSFPKLKESNFYHAQKQIDELNTNPIDFALITDITSFVNVGDILLATKGGIKIIELKEGEKNLQIKELVKENNTSSREEFLADLSKCYNEKLVKQAERMFKQSIKMQNIENLMKQEKGINSRNSSWAIADGYIDLNNDFKQELVDLINQSYLKDWAYNVIECLHIGVYRNRWLFYGRQLIEKIVEKETNKIYPIYDLANNLTTYLSAPLFIEHSLSTEQVIDIILGSTKIYIAIDFDKLFEIFSNCGAEIFWLTNKQTQKLFNAFRDYKEDFFEFEGQAIAYKYSKSRSYLTIGNLLRILYSSTLPSEIISKSLNALKSNEFEGEIDEINSSGNSLSEELKILESITLNVFNPYSSNPPSKKVES